MSKEDPTPPRTLQTPQNPPPQPAIEDSTSEAEDGIRDAQESRGLGDVYKRQIEEIFDKHYDQTRIEYWRRHLRNSTHTPPNRPDFLKQLFSPYYPVDE